MIATQILCIVPAYNEAEILPQSIPLLMDHLASTLGNEDYLVVIADNGSSDDTGKIAKQLEIAYPRRLKHELIAEKGRGRAFNRVLSKYNADQIILIDSDLPCELADINNLLTQISSGHDLAISRRTGNRPLSRRTMTRSLHYINRLVFGINFSDTQCSVKALSPKAIQVLLENCTQPGWYLDTELVVMSSKKGLKVTEIPITWIETRFPKRKSKVSPIRDIMRGTKAVVQIHRQTKNIQ